jgi:hypothetical protein
VEEVQSALDFDMEDKYWFFIILRIEQSIANNASKVKGIVQPEKRGVERGTIRTISTSYTINKVFQVNYKGLSL